MVRDQDCAYNESPGMKIHESINLKQLRCSCHKRQKQDDLQGLDRPYGTFSDLTELRLPMGDPESIFLRFHCGVLGQGRLSTFLRMLGEVELSKPEDQERNTVENTMKFHLAVTIDPTWDFKLRSGINAENCLIVKT